MSTTESAITRDDGTRDTENGSAATSTGRPDTGQPPEVSGVAAPAAAQAGDAIGGSGPSFGRAQSDRAVAADLLVDIPNLSVDELVLEVEAALVLQRVKLDAKGLEASLFVKANLDNLAMLASGSSSDDERGHDRPAGNGARMRRGLKALAGSTSEARREAPGIDAARSHESAPSASEDVGSGDCDGSDERPPGGSSRVRLQAARIGKRGAKGLGLTAAAAASGAFLESKLEPSRRLPLPRRRSRSQAVVRHIRRRLP